MMNSCVPACEAPSDTIKGKCIAAKNLSYEAVQKQNVLYEYFFGSDVATGMEVMKCDGMDGCLDEILSNLDRLNMMQAKLIDRLG